MSAIEWGSLVLGLCFFGLLVYTVVASIRGYR